jgi:hypothetical protein
MPDLDDIGALIAVVLFCASAAAWAVILGG